MAYRRTSSRRGYSRFSRPARRSSYSRGGTGYRVSRAGREIRLVIQTPSDMLPARPKVGQFARVRRRARY